VSICSGVHCLLGVFGTEGRISWTGVLGRIGLAVDLGASFFARPFVIVTGTIFHALVTPYALLYCLFPAIDIDMANGGP
jgi:hypothetical protein